MFESGDFVIQKKVVFRDHTLDQKEARPCLVLFSFSTDDGDFICTCPLTNQVGTFNKHPENYFLIPVVFKSYKKLSFVKLDCIRIYKVEEVVNDDKIGIPLDIALTKRILDKVRIIIDNKKIDNYTIINKMLNYISLFDQLETKKGKTLKKGKSINIQK